MECALDSQTQAHRGSDCERIKNIYFLFQCAKYKKYRLHNSVCYCTTCGNANSVLKFKMKLLRILLLFFRQLGLALILHVVVALHAWNLASIEYVEQ
jgi:hypothetical protein